MGSHQKFIEQEERVSRIVGDAPFAEAQTIWLNHLRQHLLLPCEVTGTDDFRWEEPYVLFGWSKAEYERLKRSQPSYRDTFLLESIEAVGSSEWAIFFEDLGAGVRRVSDRARFILGLSDIKPTNESDPNASLLEDYAYWVANNR